MFMGWPRGRRKVLESVRIIMVNNDATDNAVLIRDGGAPTVITFNNLNWLELESATARTFNNIEIFDSIGYVTEYATGPSGEEEELFLCSPGGNGFNAVRLDAGSRLVVRPTVVPVENTEIMINFYD